MWYNTSSEVNKVNFVLEVQPADAKRVERFYHDYQAPSPNEHVRFFAKTDLVTVTLFHSGKLMFQGEDAEAEYNMWESMVSGSVAPKRTRPSYQDYYYPSIGSDEVGKGDVFGPVVICSAFLGADVIASIEALGIRDSKTLSDDVIRRLGPTLVELVPHSVLTLHNEKYNELVRQGYNLNKMLAHLHNRAITNVYRKIQGEPEVFLDQFVDERNYFRYLADADKVYRKITFLPKAESRYASVAIASILARYAFLRHMDALSHDSGYDLKKGAGAQVDEVVRRIVQEKGAGFLSSYAKMNFKNVTRILNEEGI
jgi:ribonuclease HIII